MSKTNKEQKTLITLLLDRSGSMHSMKSDTIGAINSYIDNLRGSEADIRMSLVQFASISMGEIELEKTFVAQKIQKIQDLSMENYKPNGGTPLIDAAVMTIKAVEESLLGKDNIKVVVIIQTDGEENSSKKHSWSTLKSLISEKEELGWEFNFMGCGIDAYQQSEKLGLKRSNTISYGKNSKDNAAVFAATAHNTRSYAEGISSSLAYSHEQKLASGDVYDVNVLNQKNSEKTDDNKISIDKLFTSLDFKGFK
jgi:uncharacterized protein YegL